MSAAPSADPRGFASDNPSGAHPEVLDAIATHRVADRPDRYEPRLKKRRKDYCGWFTRPRAELKREMAKGVTEK